MKILLIRTAKGKNKWADAAVENWKKRFVRTIPFEEKVCRPAPAHKNIEERREVEALRVLDLLKDGDVIISLDERGSLWSTEELRDKLQQSMNRSAKRVVFIIGGPFGHAPVVRQKSNYIVSISRMVLNHEIARVCLVEQIYRVYTLIYGGDYHH